MIIDLFINTAIYAISLIKFNPFSLFFNILTLDGIISAVNFIHVVCQNSKETFAEIINKFNATNDKQLLDKYIYYIILQFSASFINVTLWFTHTIAVNNTILFLSLPYMFGIVFTIDHYSKIHNVIKTKVIDIYFYMISKLTARFMNILSEVCLQCKPNFDYREMINFYENSEESMTHSILFIKTFISLLIIHYIKRTDNVLYSYMMNMFYKYQYEPIVDSKIKKEILVSIVSQRQWDKFLDPKNVNLFFEIYGEKTDDKFVVKLNELLSKIKFKFIKFLTLWSLSIINPILSIVVNGIVNYVRKTSKKEFISYFISIFLFLIVESKVIIFMISVYGYLFILPVVDYIYEKDLKFLYKCNINKHYIIVPIVIYLFKNYSLLITPFVFLSKIPLNIKVLILLHNLLSYNAMFSMTHLMVISVITYFGVNVYIYIKNPGVADKTINILYYSNYIKNAHPKQMKENSKNDIRREMLINTNLYVDYDHFSK